MFFSRVPRALGCQGTDSIYIPCLSLRSAGAAVVLCPAVFLCSVVVIITLYKVYCNRFLKNN